MSDIFAPKKFESYISEFLFYQFFIHHLNGKSYIRNNIILTIFVPSPSVLFHVHSYIVIDLSTKCYLTRNHFSDKNLKVRVFSKKLQP